MVSDSEDFEDKIYIALSHKLRRDIIKLLAERKKMAFSELMKELGVDDTGTLTFHLRKLVGLITKISSGEYTLTNLGKKAYDIMMNMERVETLEQHNIEQKDFYIASKVKEVKPREELKPDLIFVVDRINFVIDKQLLEHTKSQGKKLLVNDVITLEIAEDIDPQLFKETVDSISDIIMIKVPKHLRSIVELKSRDVLTIKEIDVGSRTLSSIPSTI
ncbi:MAG: helix-turn-helix domain-containing protein, partial [Ignisphaera sp.]